MSKPKIGLIGPDSSGKKLGRQAQAVLEGLKEDGNDVIVFSSENAIASADVDVFFYVGKHPTYAEAVMSRCHVTATPLVGVGRHWRNHTPYIKGSKKFVFVHAENMSLQLNKLVLHLRDEIEDGHQITEIKECQQKKKGEDLPTGMIRRLAAVAQLPIEKVVSVAGTEAGEKAGIVTITSIPKKYGDDFAVYIIQSRSRNGEVKTLRIELFGREDYVAGALALCRHFTVSSYKNWLDPGYYTFDYMVRHRYL